MNRIVKGAAAGALVVFTGPFGLALIAIYFQAKISRHTTPSTGPRLGSLVAPIIDERTLSPSERQG